MSLKRRVLLVGPSGAARSLEGPLADAGYDPIVVEDFARAKTLLDARPDLLITELKLGAHNGLHLAIRAQSSSTRTIVIGHEDPVLQAEAARQQATYVVPPVDPQQIVALAAQLVQGARQTRRSVRKRVPPVDAVVNNEVHGHLCDVSYEGMRLEADQRDSPPPYFDLRLPQFDFACRVQRVWMSPADDAARVWCGVAIAGTDNTVASEWRALVDTMPGVAVH